MYRLPFYKSVSLSVGQMNREHDINVKERASMCACIKLIKMQNFKIGMHDLESYFSV